MGRDGRPREARVWAADGELLDALTELGAPFERAETGAYLVELHGRHRPSTRVWLIAGAQAVAVEAFVMHVVPNAVPDPLRLHAHLLRRNLQLRDVHYAVDDVGDVFLVGSLAAPTLELVDRVLGEVLQLLEQDAEALRWLAYGDRLAGDAVLAEKVGYDGAGRRPAGTPEWAPRRDARR
jgi:hypothetical protein